MLREMIKLSRLRDQQQDSKLSSPNLEEPDEPGSGSAGSAGMGMGDQHMHNPLATAAPAFELEGRQDLEQSKSGLQKKPPPTVREESRGEGASHLHVGISISPQMPVLVAPSPLWHTCSSDSRCGCCDSAGCLATSQLLVWFAALFACCGICLAAISGAILVQSLDDLKEQQQMIQSMPLSVQMRVRTPPSPAPRAPLPVAVQIDGVES